jgi:hypothetical protein
MRTTVVLVALLALLPGCGAVAAPSAPRSFVGCDEYRSQRSAQHAWERAGRPDGADGDGDGRVCEQLSATVDQHRACRRSRSVVVVPLSGRRYPETAAHVLDAIAAGHPRILHLERSGAAANRARSLAGIPTRAGRDREEYPPAVSREGGAGADVRYVPSADNRGAGAVMGERLGRYCDGQRFRMHVTGISRARNG